MKDRCAELCEVILLTTSVPEPIWRWPRTLRSREPRMRAHRRDSSTWRTPSPIPAPRRLGIVRRCPRLWFPMSCRGLANQRRVFASQDHISSRPTNCSLHSLLCDPEHVSSLAQGCLHQPLRQGWSCTDEVFSNDRCWLGCRRAVNETDVTTVISGGK